MSSLVNASEKEIVEAASSYETLAQLQWLVGAWVHETSEEYSKETWQQLNDSTLTGFSYTQVAQDTVFAEELILQERDGRVFLEVTAFEQNDDLPIQFDLISAETSKHIFENLEHDFPQRIVYTQPAKDSIHAWVEGTIDDALHKVDFNFKKQ